MKLNKNEILVLKKLKKDEKGYYTEHEGIHYYYTQGEVIEAKDWKPIQECGNGIHGLEWGTGSFDIRDYGDYFCVIRVDKSTDFVNLGDKVKFKKGKVILITEKQEEAIGLIKEYVPKGLLINFDFGFEKVVEQGYCSTANQGYSSTANQGYFSTANQRSSSTANQGYSSTANQRSSSTANQGYCSTANQGYSSTANQGYFSTTNQGYSSTATILGDNTIYRNYSKLGCVIMFYNNEMKVILAEENTSLYIEKGEVKFRYTHTPENITKLNPHEVIVFGSNLNGNHSGGLAKECLKFGAVEGIGEGLSGNTYAFPTLDKDMKQISLEQFKKNIDNLVKCANQNTRKIFLVTKIGTGIAGFNEEVVKELFKRNDISANIILPEGWRI